MNRYIKKLMVLNKNKGINVLIIFFLIIPSLNVYCQNNGNTKQPNNNITIEPITPRLTKQESWECKQKAIKEGDINAYNEFTMYSGVEYKKGWDYHYEKFLPIALVMANKYNSGDACADIYLYTVNFYKNCGIEIDTNTMNFLLIYLFKGAELNNRFCLNILSKLYEKGEFVPQDSVKSAEYKKKRDEIWETEK